MEQDAHLLNRHTLNITYSNFASDGVDIYCILCLSDIY